VIGRDEAGENGGEVKHAEEDAAGQRHAPRAKALPEELARGEGEGGGGGAHALQAFIPST